MNFWGDRYFRTTLGCFLAGFIFIFSAILSEKFFSWQNDPVYLKSRVENTLHEKEIKLFQYLIKLKRSNTVPSDSIPNIDFSSDPDMGQNSGMGIYVFQKDSLILWSGNKFPLPAGPVLKNFGIRPQLVKLANGWYVSHVIQDRTRVYLGLIRIMKHFAFENEYLKTGFDKDFSLPEGAKLLTGSSTNVISSFSGNYLFSIQIPSTTLPGRGMLFLIFLFYFTGFIFLIAAIYQGYRFMDRYVKRKWMLTTGFIIDLSLVRFIQFYFRVPEVLYNSDLFGPVHYSSSIFLPSLGDFFVNVILFLVICYAINKYLRENIIVANKAKKIKLLAAIIAILVVIPFLIIPYLVIRELAINSSIPLDIGNISVLSVYGLIGFLIIASVLIAALLVSDGLLGIFYTTQKNFLFSYPGRQNQRKMFPGSPGIALVILAIFATIVLNHFGEQKEKEKRKLLAIKLTISRDPLAETLFSSLEDEWMNDRKLQTFMLRPQGKNEKIPEDSLVAYIRKKYFGEAWNNYMIQVTICTNARMLRIQPQNYLASCDSFFTDLVKDIGKPTSSEHLYYLDYGFGFRNYLAIFPFGNKSDEETQNTKVYLEISSKLLFRDPGYPELLSDKNQTRLSDFSDYSYAFYRNGKLIHRIGTYDFSLDIDPAIEAVKGGTGFYNSGEMDHYFLPVDKNNILIVSKKSENWLDRVAPFSYLFLILVMFQALFRFVIQPSAVFRLQFLQFSDRLQISMIGILITSLVLTGILAVVYIGKLNKDKNLESLSERAHSIQVELQHKLGNADKLPLDKPEDLNELLIKFSNVFFCDINLYNPAGRLTSTSRPQIFDAGLISTLMDPIALKQLKYDHRSYFIHKEAIGLNRYYSAYLPFYNDQNQLLAFLNLPYFARQDDLKREISNFLMAFINIYVFLIILGFFATLIISGYITRPLRLLTQKIGKLSLGQTNEKLEWDKKDEVGRLVEEYNRMVEELAQKAELLVKSERESAWREMAKQIAHEIKNPLTPMKLSVQYLQRSLATNPDDRDQRLKRFTEAMIEQIDSLSAIASAFSDFSKMPDPINERLDVYELLQGVADLYRDPTGLSITISASLPQHFIFADKTQISRVFTNLLNNSVHAIGMRHDGEISISINRDKNLQIITVTDNGSGIPEDQAERIFEPNFTTRSGGMGLGLAIVRKIVSDAKGTIRFESKPGEGTVFIISFPAVD